MDKKISWILKKHWGYDKFRNLQEAIILSILEKKNTLALLPTGGGKSLCYQLPSLCFDNGFTLVISPLIALMKDQVDDLLDKDINAAAIYSGLSQKEIERTLDNAANGYLKLLYVSPERLQSDWFKHRLPSLPINFVAVDEAHCISQWGHDFRPSYLKIADIKIAHPKVPFIALTATATPRVIEDIKSQLLLKQPQFFSSSFYRPNLHYSIRLTDNKMGLLIKALQNCQGSSIIYVRSRQRAAQLAKNINQHGVKALFYHAGLNKVQRDERQNNWIDEPNSCIVCTSAFGMGIDKPNVRLVFHYDLTENLEAYLQESGRAGRDGKTSNCLLAFNKHDIKKLQNRFNLTFPENEIVKHVYNCLGDYLGLAVGSTSLEIYPFNLNGFCQQFNLNESSTYYALKLLQKLAYVELSNDFSQKASIKFSVSATTLLKLKQQHKHLTATIDYVLRTCPGVMQGYVRIDLFKTANNLGIAHDALIKQLNYLQKIEVAQFNTKQQKDSISLTTEYLSVDNLRLNTTTINELKEGKREQIEAVVNFLESTECRQKMMLSYFGEVDFDRCGQCDNCRSNSLDQFKGLDGLILDFVNEHPQSIPHILKELRFDPSKILNTIREMLDDGVLKKEGDVISKS